MNLRDAVLALHAQFPSVPAWLISLMLVGGALCLALLAYEAVVGLFQRRTSRKAAFWRRLLVRTRGPGRLALVILALTVAVDLAAFTPGQQLAVRHGLLMAFIVLCGWALLTAVDIGMAFYLRRYRIDLADNLQARKHLTQARILHRALDTLVVVVTIGLALTTLPGVRQLGVSLLAAGGAAGIIVGLALQPILSNLMAGVQIAFTQPIRINDAVKIEGEFGHVEEINAAYVVVRLWDQRRLIVPLRTFLEKPFENWTRDSSELLGEVLLQVDYRIPVDGLRTALMDILKSQPAWDRKVGRLVVSDALENTMVIRCVVSAGNAADLAELRFAVRERMIGFLQRQLPLALARKGVDFAPPPGDAPDSAPKQKAPDRSGAPAGGRRRRTF